MTSTRRLVPQVGRSVQAYSSSPQVSPRSHYMGFWVLAAGEITYTPALKSVLLVLSSSKQMLDNPYGTAGRNIERSVLGSLSLTCFCPHGT